MFSIIIIHVAACVLREIENIYIAIYCKPKLFHLVCTLFYVVLLSRTQQDHNKKNKRNITKQTKRNNINNILTK